MQRPTLQNAKMCTTHDAMLICWAVIRGLLPLIGRRLDSEERRHLRSGDIFVWEERAGPEDGVKDLEAPGIERWTDGMSWGPSRVRNEFLFYHQKSITTREEYRSCLTPYAPMTSVYANRDPRMPDPKDRLVKQSYSVKVHLPNVNNGEERKWHITAYFTHATLDDLRNVQVIAEIGDQVIPPGIIRAAKQQKSRRSLVEASAAHEAAMNSSNSEPGSPGRRTSPTLFARSQRERAHPYSPSIEPHSPANASSLSHKNKLVGAHSNNSLRGSGYVPFPPPLTTEPRQGASSLSLSPPIHRRPSRGSEHASEQRESSTLSSSAWSGGSHRSDSFSSERSSGREEVASSVYHSSSSTSGHHRSLHQHRRQGYERDHHEVGAPMNVDGPYPATPATNAVSSRGPRHDRTQEEEEFREVRHHLSRVHDKAYDAYLSDGDRASVGWQQHRPLSSSSSSSTSSSGVTPVPHYLGDRKLVPLDLLKGRRVPHRDPADEVLLRQFSLADLR